MTNKEKWSRTFNNLGLIFEIWTGDEISLIDPGEAVFTVSKKDDPQYVVYESIDDKEFHSEEELYRWLSDNYEFVLQTILDSVAHDEQ